MGACADNFRNCAQHFNTKDMYSILTMFSLLTLLLPLGENYLPGLGSKTEALGVILISRTEGEIK